MAERKNQKRGGIYPVMEKGVQQKDKQGRPKWIIQAYAGKVFNPKSGKFEPKVITKRFAGTKRDAKVIYTQLKSEIDRGLKVDKRNVTLNEYVPLWLKKKESKGARPSSIKWSETMINHVTKLIGDARLRDIDNDLITQVFVTLKNDTSINNGKGLSGTTRNAIYKQLRQLFEQAVENDIIPKNPCSKNDAPEKDETNRSTLKPEQHAELARFIDQKEQESISAMQAKESRMAKLGRDKVRERVVGISNLSALLATRIALYTGCRRGEVLALTWDCVELGEHPKIYIEKSITPEMEVKEPKSKKSNRVCAISRDTADHIEQMHRIQEEYLPSVLGRSVRDDDPVCPSNTGGFFSPRNFSRWWDAFRKDAGYPDLKFHELRHTAASLLDDAGVSPGKIRDFLGHVDLKTTYGTYVHSVNNDGVQEAADALSRTSIADESESETSEDK